MASTTRSVRAYRFPHWGKPETFYMTVRHYDIGDGIEIPLFDNVFTIIGHVEKGVLDYADPVTFHVYYTTTCSTGGPNEALFHLPDGPAFRGELVVMRRAVLGDGFVHLRRGDVARATRAALDLITAYKLRNEIPWNDY